MLHILNGDAVVSVFKDSGIEGDYAIWREVHCQGPACEIINSEKFAQLRTEFLREYIDIPFYFYDQNSKAELEKILQSTSNDITMWFEYDLFCQINMMVAINLILQNKPEVTIYLVNVGKTLAHSEWITLGQLTPVEWLEQFRMKKKIDEQAADFIKKSWKIYCSDRHLDFEKIMPECPSVFKYFPQAIENHYRRFPSRADGLTDIQRYILENLSSEYFTSSKKFIGQMLRDFHFYGYGDLQYKAILDSMNYFIIFHENNGYRLKNKFNGSILSGELKYLPQMTYGGQRNKDQYLEDFIEI